MSWTSLNASKQIDSTHHLTTSLRLNSEDIYLTEKGDLFDNSGTISKLTGKPTTTLKQAVSDALKVK